MGDYMERNEFISYLYETVSMGYEYTDKLVNILKNKENKINIYLKRYREEYSKYKEELEGIIRSENIDVSKKIVANIMSSLGMNLEMMKDNSDTKVADMLIQGYTMGILDISKKLKKYDKYITTNDKRLANRINKTQEENIKELKAFL